MPESTGGILRIVRKRLDLREERARAASASLLEGLSVSRARAFWVARVRSAERGLTGGGSFNQEWFGPRQRSRSSDSHAIRGTASASLGHQISRRLIDTSLSGNGASGCYSFPVRADANNAVLAVSLQQWSGQCEAERSPVVRFGTIETLAWETETWLQMGANGLAALACIRTPTL